MQESRKLFELARPASRVDIDVMGLRRRDDALYDSLVQVQCTEAELACLQLTRQLRVDASVDDVHAASRCQRLAPYTQSPLPHFCQMPKAPEPPHIFVLSPPQGMLQFPRMPALGARVVGRLVPQ